jgi:uncharacterized repeat protein (TIGR03803 family)
MHSKNISLQFVQQPVQLFRIVTFAVAMLILALSSIPSNAQYSALYNFGNKSGDPLQPQYSGIIAQGRDGELYTTSPNGGTACSFCGTVFKITPSGSLAIVHSFDFACPPCNGNVPQGGVTLGTDGNFYGTTHSGGKFNLGTVFAVTPAGILTTLYNFGTCAYPCPEGAYPNAPPIQGVDGNFYGTTAYSTSGTNYGVLYKTTSAGKFTTLYAFNGVTGRNPNDPLIQATDGNFYGTTALGGKSVQPSCFGSNPSCGTVFKMTPAGKVTFIYQFDKTHGAGPIGPVVQGSDGNFYGTTSGGGDANGDGVIFKLTPLGVITVLHNFNGTDGKQPTAGLVQASDGNFYGTASAGGTKGFGTLYKITSAGVFSVLNNFDNTSGATPEVTLFQHTTGVLYGDTFSGGSHSDGVFYSLVAQLPPFVILLPTSGKIGTSIGFLGQGFSGATNVSFNGISANFTVTSDTYLTAVVPSLAVTGTVTVTTPSGKLPSKKIFTVVPSITSFTPTSAKVGASVVIKGGGFTKASQVTFGGVKATIFTVNSAAQVTATVPVGAKTGKIGITTPAGTATSSGTFTVLP